MSARRTSVEKRPGVFYRIGRDGNRQYEVTWLALDAQTGQKRRRWLRVEGSLEDAQARLEQERTGTRQGERKPTAQEARQTFREVAQAWFDSQSNLRPRTREKYEGAIRVHLNPRLGSMRITDVTEDEIARLIADMQAKGAAGWTIKGTLTPLGRILGYAVRRRLLPRNPLGQLDKDERPKVSGRKPRILDSDEIAQVLDACTDAYRPIIATAIFTGLRQGELLGLTWADIDFDAGFVRVQKQLDRKTRERVEPKTEQAVRDVVLMPALGSILRRHKAASPHSQPDDFVFCTRSGKPHSGRNVAQRGLDKALERVGLGESTEGEDGRRRWQSTVTFHALRHTFVSLLIAQGEDVLYVSGQVGHAKSSTTMDVYGHLFDQARHARDSRTRLEAAYGNLFETAGGDGWRQAVAAGGGKVLDLAKTRAGGNA